MSFIIAFWFSFIRFLGNLFNKSPSKPPLPIPVTSRVTPWVKEPTPLKPAGTESAACSATPERIFHPPAGPFPNISLSGIFATSPRLISNTDLGLASPPEPRSPSPFRGSHGTASPSPCTPRTPSSPVMVPLDRSTISPTTMSDGSLEVISLRDRHGFPGSPVNIPDIALLPSPWSPIGRMTSSDVWMSVDGMLMNATGPVDDDPAYSLDDSARTAMLSSLTLSRMSTVSLYSSSSALDALGISVFVNLSTQGNNVDTRNDPTTIPKLNQVRDENRPTLVTQPLQTPPKRRETFTSVAKYNVPSHSSRATKCLSTPLVKLDNVDISHLRSASSMSSLAYELRMGLFSDGRSMTAFENIIPLLDQASPESIPPHNDSMQPMEVI